MNREQIRILGLAIVVAALACCSGKDNGNKDGAPHDVVVGEGGSLPDGLTLYDCDKPGQACNAHNACAIDPICGPDKKCRPSRMQDCDDGLACTKDVCKGMGLCDHVALEGNCMLPVKKPATKDGGVGTTALACFKHKDRSPNDSCQVCNADPVDKGGNPTQWLPANGGACDDGNACTKDDYCQAGICKGDDFKKVCEGATAYACKEVLCDGKGGCLGNPLKPDWCLINGVCAKDGEQDTTGCNKCDVKVSQSKWSPLGANCTIAAKCYKPGDKDTTGCGICDPTKNDKDWTPIAGLCKIGTVCYKAAAKHPLGCAECDPLVSATAWTVKTDQCLISDICYQPGAKDATGCAACDPAKSKTAFTPLANQCLISTKCYSTGAKDPTTCGECDPAVSTSTWTVKVDKCLIADKCYLPAQNDPVTGCGTCDPAKSKTAWTPVASKCLIGAQCFADQAKDKTGCLLCDVAKNPKGWTPVAGAKTTLYDFEDGKSPPTGWTIKNTDTKVGWTVTNKRPGGGSYSLYYGDPAVGNYETSGTDNSGTATLPSIPLTAGKKAGLSFLVWMDTESGSSYDMLTVTVNGVQVWEKDSTTVPAMKAWHEATIDLSTYAGQSVVIIFTFDTSDSVSNSSEGTYVDNVTIFENC